MQVNETSKKEDGWSPTNYAKHASFVYSQAFTSPVLDLLDARPGERILDLGCGSGELGIIIEKSVGTDGELKGVVVGVDQSVKMVEKARENGFQKAFVADIHDLTTIFPPNPDPSSELYKLIPSSSSTRGSPNERKGEDREIKWEFDAVFSNAVLHWCKRDPEAVVREVARVLRKGGRFAGEMGGFMNLVGLRSAIHTVLRRRGHSNPERYDPWYFPSAESYKDVLTRAGFRVTHIALVPRITPLTSSSQGNNEGGIIGWQRTFCTGAGMIYSNAGLSEQEMEEVMKEVEELCEVDCKDAEGRWGIMYVRLRFVAIKD